MERKDLPVVLRSSSDDDNSDREYDDDSCDFHGDAGEERGFGRDWQACARLWVVFIINKRKSLHIANEYAWLSTILSTFRGCARLVLRERQM